MLMPVAPVPAGQRDISPPGFPHGAKERTVVLPVQVVDQRLDARLVEVPDVARRLARLLAGHGEVRVDRPEAVNDDLAAHRLDWVDDDGDGTRVELLE